MLIPREVHEILEEMNEEVFKNMAVENANAIRRYVDRIIKFYQSKEADGNVDASISDDDIVDDCVGIIEDDIVEDVIDDSEAKEDAKTDYDKIIFKLGAVKMSLGVVSLSDVIKVIGEEMLPNVRGKDSFTQIIPGDSRFINVLDIMNKIVSTINLNYQDNRINDVSILKGLLSDLEETIKSLDSKPNQNDTEKCNKVCDYLLGLKSKSFASLECLTLPAFFDLMVKLDIIESDEEILKKLSENPMTNVVFFELIKSVKTLEGKPTESWYESTSRLVLQFKSFYNLAKSVTKFSFPNRMTINPFYGTNSGKANTKPGFDPTSQNVLNYQKAAAFDKIVEALRPVFIELANESPLMKGFGSPLNGCGWGSPFNMNPMFKV